MRFRRSPFFAALRPFLIGGALVAGLLVYLVADRNGTLLTGGQQDAETPTGALTGTADVIDGDTLELGGTRIRLYGIDAPEMHQRCYDENGTADSCGQIAAAMLRQRIGGGAVACDPRDTDRYGRTVAVCRAGGADLNEWMVENGWAVAYRHYSLDYVAAEDDARARHAGIWAGRFENPRAWRREHPR
jgi:endonuclease YncB( thermonuclease family)